jgi:hypothetical protein
MRPDEPAQADWYLATAPNTAPPLTRRVNPAKPRTRPATTLRRPPLQHGHRRRRKRSAPAATPSRTEKIPGRPVRVRVRTASRGAASRRSPPLCRTCLAAWSSALGPPQPVNSRSPRSAVISVRGARPDSQPSRRRLCLARNLGIHPGIVERPRGYRHDNRADLSAAWARAAEVMALSSRDSTNDEPDDQQHRYDAHYYLPGALGRASRSPGE